MNILIENSESLEYFAGEGRWSQRISEARIFRDTSLAFRAAKQELVGRFNIVGYIPDTRQFVNLNHGRGKGVGEILADPAASPAA